MPLRLIICSLVLAACGDFDNFDRRILSPQEDRRIIVIPDNQPAPPPNPQPPPPEQDGAVPAPPEQDAGVPSQPPDQGSTTPPPPTGQCGMLTFEEEVFKLVNQERSKRGLSVYTCCPQAVKVSRAYSQLMCDKKFFSHTGPGGSTPEKRFQAAGIAYSSWVGENIAYGAQTPASVMSMWMNSSGHRAAILSKSFSHIGVGYAPCEGGGGGWFGGGQHYWTQNFYVPKTP